MSRYRVALVALATAISTAHADCPKPVLATLARVFPSASVSRCDRERGQFEARLVRSDGGKLEVDLSADGTILQIEEAITVDKLPSVVSKAFATRYPKAKATGAEKQTAGKRVTYEIKFDLGAARREATFDESGKFIEEE